LAGLIKQTTYFTPIYALKTLNIFLEEFISHFFLHAWLYIYKNKLQKPTIC